MLKKLIFVMIGAALLGGCATSEHKLSALPVAEGPEPEVIDQSQQRTLACIASAISGQRTGGFKAKPRRIPSFGVLDIIDKTGGENRVGNDSFGTFMSQGVGEMLITALGTMRVPTVELSPSYRNVSDWGGKNKLALIQQVDDVNAKGEKGPSKRVLQPIVNARMPEYGIIGAITSLSFIPGGHAGAGVGGVNGSYYKNAALAEIDLRVVEMPKPGRPGGTVVARAMVSKQIVQDGFGLTLDRYIEFGPARPRLVNLEFGWQNREPMKAANRAMVNVGGAEVVAQTLGFHDCLATPNVVVALN